MFGLHASRLCRLQAIYPHFKALAKQVSALHSPLSSALLALICSTSSAWQNKQHRYVLTHCEYLDKEARGIRHTPTFKVFHHGRVVDRFIAVEHRELADHIWLHSED